MTKWGCKPKVKGESRGGCPIWVAGILRDGTELKRQPIGTRNRQEAEDLMRDMQAGIQAPKAAVTLRHAADLYLTSKSKLSVDRKRKLKLLVNRIVDFAAKHGKSTVIEVDLDLLVQLVASWTDANTTQRRNRENLKSFFRYCVKAKYIIDNPADDLDTIPDTTPQTDVFTDEEMESIITALPKFGASYKRDGESIGMQTNAFALVMRFTGLSIGDVVSLPKADVKGNQIITNRNKTGKEVYVKVPQFVIDALNAAPHDSEKYYFWSGQGLIHTRTSKWGERLQRLFVLAGVRLADGKWRSKQLSGKKQPTGIRVISMADPRWFRHTFAVELLKSGLVTMAQLAEILGNTEAVCIKHYSRWDVRRQDGIDKTIEALWEKNPTYKMLNKVELSGSAS